VSKQVLVGFKTDKNFKKEWDKWVKHPDRLKEKWPVSPGGKVFSKNILRFLMEREMKRKPLGRGVLWRKF